jgi:hypothetical protein
VNAADGSAGGSRRSGRRSSEQLRRIPVGSSAPVEDDEPDSESTEAGPKETPPSRRPKPAPLVARGRGLDRIKPRSGPATSGGDRPDAAGGGDLPDLGAAAGDPLGKAALYSSGAQESSSGLGTFLVECSTCRRETPVVAGDLVRLGLPSFHLPFVKRFPSLMRCPACGRRTWVRVRWHL